MFVLLFKCCVFFDKISILYAEVGYFCTLNTYLRFFYIIVIVRFIDVVIYLILKPCIITKMKTTIKSKYSFLKYRGFEL